MTEAAGAEDAVRRRNALAEYSKKLLKKKELESRVGSVRENLRASKKEYNNKTEDDSKSLQSIEQTKTENECVRENLPALKKEYKETEDDAKFLQSRVQIERGIELLRGILQALKKEYEETEDYSKILQNREQIEREIERFRRNLQLLEMEYWLTKALMTEPCLDFLRNPGEMSFTRKVEDNLQALEKEYNKIISGPIFREAIEGFRASMKEYKKTEECDKRIEGSN